MRRYSRHTEHVLSMCVLVCLCVRFNETEPSRRGRAQHGKRIETIAGELLPVRYGAIAAGKIDNIFQFEGHFNVSPICVGCSVWWLPGRVLNIRDVLTVFKGSVKASQHSFIRPLFYVASKKCSICVAYVPTRWSHTSLPYDEQHHWTHQPNKRSRVHVYLPSHRTVWACETTQTTARAHTKHMRSVWNIHRQSFAFTMVRIERVCGCTFPTQLSPCHLSVFHTMNKNSEWLCEYRARQMNIQIRTSFLHTLMHIRAAIHIHKCGALLAFMCAWLFSYY